jgi:hypothetical protein
MHSVRTGKSAFTHIFGMGVWQYRAQHPESAKIFDEAMANLVGVYNSAVLASYSFSSIEKLVDVGGGDGSLIIAILQKGTQDEGGAFGFASRHRKSETEDRRGRREWTLRIVAGDAFDSVPSGADAYILSRVINAFDDKRAITILQNCHRAIQDKGKLLLFERVVPDRVEHSVAAQGPVMSDLNLLVIGGGRETYRDGASRTRRSRWLCSS